MRTMRTTTKHASTGGPLALEWATFSMTTKIEKAQAEARALLKNKGMRATAQRLAVLVTLYEHRTPMTHEEVMASLAKGLYDKASIWRVLSDLAGVGIARRMDLGDRVWRYELNDSRRAAMDDHPHFLCEVCSEVTCLPPLEVRAKGGGLPDELTDADFQIRITGTCGTCVTV
jgi:Fur family ferric uptake transcriptional regulator